MQLLPKSMRVDGGLGRGMKKFRYCLCSFMLLSCMCACAAPKPPVATQNFVSERELLAVSLARQGMAAFSDNKFVDAELFLRQALYLRPQAPSVQANLAIVLRAGGNFSGAEDLLEDLIRRYPQQSEYQEALARLRYEQSDLENARVLFARLLLVSEQSNDVASLARYARTLSGIAFRQGDEESALCYSLQAVNAKPETEEFARHARLLLAQEKPQQAIAFLQAKTANPELPATPDFLYLLSLAYFAQGDFVKAREFDDRLAEFSSAGNSSIAEVKALRALLASSQISSSDGAGQAMAAAPSLPADHRVSLPHSFVEAIQLR